MKTENKKGQKTVQLTPAKTKPVINPSMVLIKIKCSEPGCKNTREIPTYQKDFVTRCEDCQKAHMKAKKREKTKARNKVKIQSKRLSLREEAMELLGQIEGTPDVMRALAQLIRETYPKA